MINNIISAIDTLDATPELKVRYITRFRAL